MVAPGPVLQRTVYALGERLQASQQNGHFLARNRRDSRVGSRNQPFQVKWVESVAVTAQRTGRSRVANASAIVGPTLSRSSRYSRIGISSQKPSKTRSSS